MPIKSLQDIPVTVKTVLLRLDLNLPIINNTIVDDSRICRSLPTIQGLLDRNYRVVILSHFGRPKGLNPKESLIAVALHFRQYFTCPILFSSDCIGPSVQMALQEAPPGSLIILENLRFHPEEEGNDSQFAKEISSLGQAYINDAFSASHRSHASIVGIPKFLPAYTGLAMAAELEALEKFLIQPKPPVMAIVGGSKISTKLDLLKNLVTKFDYLVPGGGIANTFLAALNHNIGISLREEAYMDSAREIMDLAQQHKCQIILPEDAQVSSSLTGTQHREIKLSSIKDNEAIYDVGSKTIEKIQSILKSCKTVIWNGPLGVYEVPPYDKSSRDLAEFISRQTCAGELVSIAGGGDTLAALKMSGHLTDFTYTSTAGGAFLEWLEGKQLPGIEALQQS